MKQHARKLKLLQIENLVQKTYFWPKYCTDAENVRNENTQAENMHAETAHVENVRAETESHCKKLL